ncbi:MAG TPA: hypothetical protein VI700_01645, partial [Thermoanaerobaculaceae bacterium]|nr:hypothetical protein [Thermoanaerobaculaceae bacterium]
MSSASGEPKLVKLDDLPKLLLPDETVGSASHSLKPLRCRVESRLPIVSKACPGVVFTVKGGSEVSVFAFNAPTDRDPDLVLVPTGAGGAEGRAGQLELTPGSCWLKVQHRASVGPEGG